MRSFNVQSLRGFVALYDPPIAPTLHDVLAPLRLVPPRPFGAALEAGSAAARHEATVAAQEVIRSSKPRSWAPGTDPARAPFTSANLDATTVDDAIAEYSRRLPEQWVTWIQWTKDVYPQRIPADMPYLLDAFNSLVLVESQLQVAAAYANRDHVLHQLADGFMGAELAEALGPVPSAELDQSELLAVNACLSALGLDELNADDPSLWRADCV